MIRLLLADDHGIVRSGLIQIFRAMAADIEVVGEASQSNEVIEHWRSLSCDVLLLDMTMPGLCGVDLIARLHAEKPYVPILVLSMKNEAQVIARALRAGAAGYVSKSSKPDVLLAAIRKVAAGGKFLDPSLVDSVVFDAGTIERDAECSLSRRELQVLTLVAAGYPLGRIAEQLNLSPKTISTHKVRLMRKLAIDNNADLVRYASRNGFAPE